MLQLRIRDGSLFLTLAVLSACGGSATTSPEPNEPIRISGIVSGTEPIDPESPLPEFSEFFDEGESVIYTFVSFENTETMTGSFPVRLRWFSPNDFRPPIAQRVIEMQPGQNIAQFSIHNEDSLPKGPYQIIARTGKDLSDLTASGSARFFIGMTEDEALTFLEEEDVYREKKEEERRKREEEEKLKSGTGSQPVQGEAFSSGVSPDGERVEKPSEEDSNGLPPELTSGIE